MAFPGVDRLAPLLVPVALVAALLLAQEQGPPRPLSAPRPVVQHKPALVGRAAPALQKPLAPKPSVFAQESAMSYSQLIDRWNPLVKEASRRFNISGQWIRAVIMIESGGKTMLTEDRPITSVAGAMGLMQLMPETYREMRRAYALGPDPYDPHDNIMAGAATLSLLYQQYGYPTMFAAYNDGPGNLEQRLAQGNMLPAETRLYLVNVTASVEGRKGIGRALAQLTRPNGEPVLVDCSAVVRVRAAMPDEYAPGVLTVVTVGKIRQGVREAPARATAIIRAHGGAI